MIDIIILVHIELKSYVMRMLNLESQNNLPILHFTYNTMDYFKLYLQIRKIKQ